MSGTENKRGNEPWVNSKRLRLFVVYPILGIVGLWLCYLWLGPAFYGFTLARERRAELAPMLSQAKAAGLTYEKALADPAATEGKFVVWCVQNRGQDSVTVGGDVSMRLLVSNYPAMPFFTGSKHESCAPMLLLLEKPVSGRRIQVFFEEAL